MGRLSIGEEIGARQDDYVHSKSQSVVVKSSGESELNGVVRASTEGLGIVTLPDDFIVPDVQVSIGMDASAVVVGLCTKPQLFLKTSYAVLNLSD